MYLPYHVFIIKIYIYSFLVGMNKLSLDAKFLLSDISAEYSINARYID